MQPGSDGTVAVKPPSSLRSKTTFAFIVILSTSNRLRTFQLSQDMACERLFDLVVSRNRLANAGLGILVPIVSPAMSEEHATLLFDLADQVNTLHEIGNSATWRTPGIFPPVRSS